MANNPADSVFGDEPQIVPDTPRAQEIELKVAVSDWVGEGKKYRTEEEYHKAFAEAQAHIDRLTSSYKEINVELAKRDTIKDMLDQLKSQQAPSAQPAPVQDPNEGQSLTSADQLAALVKKEVKASLDSFVTINQSQANEQRVSGELRNLFGTQVGVAIKKKAEELGISIEDMQTLARDKPNIVLGLFPELKKQSPSRPIPPSGNRQGTVNTDSGTFNKDASARNNAYYQGLRRSNPTQYFSPAIQLQILSDAEQQGPDFYR